MHNFLFIACLFLIMVFLSNPAYACVCPRNVTVQEGLKQSAAVFVGEVIAIQDRTANGEDYDDVLFSVTKVWKGNIPETISILTPSRSSCSYKFKLNTQYLVYADSTSLGLHTNNCTRTQVITSAQEDLKELGSGFNPIQKEGGIKSILFGAKQFAGFILFLTIVLFIVISRKFRASKG